MGQEPDDFAVGRPFAADRGALGVQPGQEPDRLKKIEPIGFLEERLV
jgi:hypothetical protein